ncbi:uncharacterized protein LOC121806898 isoform X2 [Salvia splendens]|uniref:uncharacterized protein LOC121806898 isoform X2 n=1 Tax=Salvia splendens TaxID=180675 RepID=UPI001C27F434|nr:uncharacterized protein LOC121806898 isoform X2 [Salvia splendens]
MERSLGTYDYRKSYMSLTHYTECKDFFRLIRESRGYDIVSYPSYIMKSGLLDRTLRPLGNDVMLANLNFRETLRCHGEQYLKDSFVNIVWNMLHGLSVVTFTVKQIDRDYNHVGVVKTVQTMVSVATSYGEIYEVKEWRFKPSGSQMDWE